MTSSSKYGSTSSKYCYPETNTLINKLDIKDEDKLQEVENLYSTQRLLQLKKEPLLGNFDLEHLQNIHYHIFQDIYDFAGQIRGEEISKGTTLFAQSRFILTISQDLFDQLKKDNFLVGLKPQDFANKVSYYMGEINMLHPFREGNGRAIREFIRTLALNADYKLQWKAISKEELLAASIRSIIDTDPLSRCILKAIKSN